MEQLVELVHYTNGVDLQYSQVLLCGKEGGSFRFGLGWVGLGRIVYKKIKNCI